MKATKYKIQNPGFRIRKTDSISILGSEKGMVLILSIMLLLVATVVGITALSTSTINVMIAGNQRLNELCFSAADSGINVSNPIIDDTAYYGVVDNIYQGGASPLVPDTADFVTEIGGTVIIDTTPDITYALGGGTSASTVNIDVDYLYAAAGSGCAIEFANGYKGVGQGTGACGEIYFGLYSQGQCPAGAETAVCSVYKYVIK